MMRIKKVKIPIQSLYSRRDKDGATFNGTSLAWHVIPVTALSLQNGIVKATQGGSKCHTLEGPFRQRTTDRRTSEKLKEIFPNEVTNG